VKAVFLFVLGLFAGALIAWAVMPRPHRFVYRTTGPVALADKNGVHLGTIPQGTPLLSEEEVSPGADLGWSGSIPVYLGSMDEAALLVSSSNEKPSLVAPTVNGHRPADLVRHTPDGAPVR
jgi:hypothetical protein